MSLYPRGRACSLDRVRAILPSYAKVVFLFSVLLLLAGYALVTLSHTNGRSSETYFQSLLRATIIAFYLQTISIPGTLIFYDNRRRRRATNGGAVRTEPGADRFAIGSHYFLSIFFKSGRPLSYDVVILYRRSHK